MKEIAQDRGRIRLADGIRKNPVVDVLPDLPGREIDQALIGFGQAVESRLKLLGNGRVAILFRLQKADVEADHLGAVL